MFRSTPHPFVGGLMTVGATLIVAAIFLAGYGLGFWQGMQSAYNDPPPFEWYQGK